MKNSRLLLGLILLSTLFSVGCVTNGRRILLKEYGPSVAALENQPLAGVTINLKPFDVPADLTTMELKGKPDEPKPFRYSEFTQEQDREWEKESKLLQKGTRKTSWKIGNMRNGFGMVMSHVYALNDPRDWFMQALKYDLEAQGARVVENADETADVKVSGTIELCRLDMYMTVNSSIVVHLQVQGKDGEPRRRKIHTNGATAAMLASEGEYFHALRDARQKFSVITIQEIRELLKKP